MEAAFRLQSATIAMVGLGLMGGSLALALKGRCRAIYGIDCDDATLARALEGQIVDRADRDAGKLLPQADVVVLATPVPAILDYIRRLPSLTQNPCIVLDLGSTKSEIVRCLARLPGHFDVLGGHPICGREKLGLEHAEAALYQGAAFVITPLARTTSRSRSLAGELIAAIGAHGIEMDAEEHDRALAFTSHLPFVLSAALALSTSSAYSPLIGTGYRSTARLAGTPSSMTLGIMQSNREHVLEAIHRFRASLDEIASALQDDNDGELKALLDHSCATYRSLLSTL